MEEHSHASVSAKEAQKQGTRLAVSLAHVPHGHARLYPMLFWGYGRDASERKGPRQAVGG
eukprot:CAMPEP_0174375392 /NCGR_PEP_ID=MMETSP0811_2-20130205/114456_1 /TAXON_ID=73025 ORGANISM="Eutreptiella gymnastica-like, Strain CCMP1594" /NCGR_SAMPLE_ID=MMETSP0811_2 /ASSEMBLY_ACC=CAM_ASM_000667 /LENGTH=59 /DNA_ID=CAMNT_0015525579 /DNA_START=32 /DNA_END=207 /DNA_ORIENTATION=+